MEAGNPIRPLRAILAVLPPALAFMLEWIFSSHLQGRVWILFYPAVFLSSWIGGLAGGLTATALSSALAVYFFLPPQFSLRLEDPKDLLSLGLFMGVGVMFSLFHDRLRKSTRQATEAAVALRSANERLESGVLERTAALAQANETLRESEARFRLLIDGVKDYAVILLDPQGRVVTWNDGARRLKGYAEAEILGQSMKRFYSGEDVAEGKPDRQLALATAEGRCEDEGWRVRKDGTRFVADMVLTAMRDEAGELVGFAKITRDITARKQAEESARLHAEELRAANMDLERINRSMVDRELRMIELKQEINALCRQCGQPPRHALDFDEAHP